jgi:hypothetical protein
VGIKMANTKNLSWGERLCTKIEKYLIVINIFPVKKSFGVTSFEIAYKYGNGILEITGKRLDSSKAKSIEILNNQNGNNAGNLCFTKTDFIQKNILEALRLILVKDSLPRCPKCGVRPIQYTEYKYHTQEIDADNNGIPILEHCCPVNHSKPSKIG